MKKNKILAGILFGMPLGAIVGIWVGVTVSLWIGIAVGAIVFVGSGWGFLQLAIGAAQKQQNRYVELREEIGKTEHLCMDALANYESAGKLYLGRLFLTEEAVHFAGKTKEGAETRFRLPRESIALASSYKPSEYVTTGLQLRLRDGKVYRLIVEAPEEWIEAIKRPV